MKTEQLYHIFLKHPLICTDTRKIAPSCLFFALKGDSFDGNEFAAKALQSGAAYAVIDNAKYAENNNFILVDNVLETLQELARFKRSKLNIPVIGITGTNGKTTTKELIRSVLSEKYRTYATEGNLNNHIGVPLSILSIKDDCEIAIIEMGANHQKEIAFLCTIAKPSHGLITNVGKAHLEGFGGLEGVRIAKGELYDYLAGTAGILFINSDNTILTEMSGKRDVKTKIGYGEGNDNFITAKLKTSSPYLSIEWHSGLTGKVQSSHTAISNLPGIYNFENILAAICIGSFFRLLPDEINQGIAAYHPLNTRSQIRRTQHNTLICDYYNANPDSMMVALENLENTPADHKVMILADMFELGNEAAQEHLAILKKAREITADKRIFIGKEFFRLKDNKDYFYVGTEDAYEALRTNPVLNSCVLIKGSRGMKLESLLGLL